MVGPPKGNLPFLLLCSFVSLTYQEAGNLTTGGAGQRCYVCVPGEMSSKEVASFFPIPTPGDGEGKRRLLPDCSNFSPETAGNFEFNCPATISGGCLLKRHGTQVSRTCAPIPLNDCKTANSVEYCYCTGQLCNAAPPILSPSVPRGRTVLWTQEQTDDEDLLGPEGSGRPPPSTPIPTLHSPGHAAKNFPKSMNVQPTSSSRSLRPLILIYISLLVLPCLSSLQFPFTPGFHGPLGR